LVDGVVAVNEIIDLAKRSQKECLIFKVDFEKKHMIRSAVSFLGVLSHSWLFDSLSFGDCFVVVRSI
jgi:hypothetical protein